MAVFSFKTRIEEDDEVEFDIKVCCAVSESSLSDSWISSAWYLISCAVCSLGFRSLLFLFLWQGGRRVG